MNYRIRDIWIQFPNLVIDVLNYFSTSNRNIEPKNKSIFNFVNSNLLPNGQVKYQPYMIEYICDRLCDSGIIECVRSAKGLSHGSNYLYTPGSPEFFQINKDYLLYYFNSLVYGFDYIYQAFKDNVIPIIGKDSNGNLTMGTCFRFANGLLTAKHCILDLSDISINGYSSEKLNNSHIYVSSNDNLDIAFIDINEPINSIICGEDAHVLDEILVMGFPKIPTFTDFLTAELATISSKATVRLTPTKGYVAAQGKEFLSKVETLLITAKIKGGNSGGPVINGVGSIVGVACQIPYYGNEIGDYDDMGYGVALPIKYAEDIVKNKEHEYNKKANLFVDR